jgi:hypothetical protein
MRPQHKHSRTLRFRLVLPVAQLILCFAILWPLRNMIIFEIRSSMGKPQAPGSDLRSGPVWISPFFVILGPWGEFLPPAVQRQTVWIPALLNVPSMVFELPHAIFSSDHSAWSPRGFDFRLWRAITWPFGGILFWWIAGRGIDSLLAARRRLITPSITWAETGVGVLSLASGVLLCGISVASRMDDDHLTASWQLIGLAGTMWVLLGTATIAARFVQWRLRRVRSS